MTQFETTDQLIARLAATAEPVQRLRPPLLRACLWLLAIAAISTVGILAFADLHVFARRIADPKLLVEIAGTLATGITATIAAFNLSLPDRSRAWLLAPLPFLALWIGSSGYACYREWLRFGPEGWTFGESTHCFLFIIGFSIPLGLSLWWLLRRARPISPIPVALAGGLAVAACAAFLLQFFHPFDITAIDLALQLTAVGVVIAVGCVRPPVRA